MNKTKLFKYVSNISFGVGAALAVYAIVTIFITRASLPPGACPIDTSRPVVYIAVGFLAISLITSFFTGKKKEKENTQSD